MAGTDSLTDLWAPNLISRFDQIPAEAELPFPISKGEIALLIKSTYQLHQGLSAMMQVVGPLAFSDEARAAVTLAYTQLQSSQTTFSTVANSWIQRSVEGWYGDDA